MRQERREDQKKPRLLEFLGKVFGAALLFGLGLFVSLFAGFVLFEGYISSGSVLVPDVRNMTLLEAINKATRLGLRLEVERVTSDSGAPSQASRSCSRSREKSQDRIDGASFAISLSPVSQSSSPSSSIRSGKW